MSFNNARERQESAPESGPVRYLPCKYCGKQTLVETLSQYGARCLPCFDAYCAQDGTGRKSRGIDRAAIERIGKGGEGGPRAWADRLRERHQAGERLTRTQIEAYKAVANES
jgi:hypothetical protein